MKVKHLLQITLVSCVLFIGAPKVQAGAEPYIGEVSWFAGNFAPRGWAFCNGQLLSISENTALFSLLGTTYGGDGRTTFALPDARGRAFIHAGTGPGLSSRALGSRAGTQQESLTVSQMPAHTHTSRANSGAASSANPEENVLANSGRANLYSGSANVNMNTNAITSTGGSQPHNNMQPFLTLNCIIALQGIFPSRN